jgi:hypothetical protein
MGIWNVLGRKTDPDYAAKFLLGFPDRIEPWDIFGECLVCGGVRPNHVIDCDYVDALSKVKVSA